jgi:CheY-like chemotaxis protein
LNEGGHFSLSVRLAEGEALVTVAEEGPRISNELVRRALEQALARRPAERAYTVRIALAEPCACAAPARARCAGGARRARRPRDLSMPGVDGYRVVERLKSDASFARVSFVAVTGSKDHQARRRSEEAEFAEQLVKPVELATLRSLLERL